MSAPIKLNFPFFKGNPLFGALLTVNQTFRMRRYNLDVKPPSAACSSSIVIGIFISLPNTHWFCLLGCGLRGVVNSDVTNDVSVGEFGK